VTGPCNLSVIIPAFNEGPAIHKTITTTAQYLAGLPLSWEMIVVDDGSQDTTAADVTAAATATAPEQIRLIRHTRNLGKGAAIRTGVLASAGQFVLFCDADSATPIEELGKFLPRLRDGADIVVGSRRITGSEVRRRQPWPRQFLGTVYVWLTNLLVVPGISDITCGFKALRRRAAHEIFSRAHVTGWSFDAELFYLARRLRYRIVEVPITWADQPNTKVRVARDAMVSLYDLVRIRWRAMTGQYR